MEKIELLKKRERDGLEDDIVKKKVNSGFLFLLSSVATNTTFTNTNKNISYKPFCFCLIFQRDIKIPQTLKILNMKTILWIHTIVKMAKQDLAN